MSWTSCVCFGLRLHLERNSLLRNKDMQHHVSRTKHLVLQAVHKGTAGTWGDEVNSVCVQFLLRGVVSPLSARGELSRRKEVLGPFMGRTLPLDRQGGEEKAVSGGSYFVHRLWIEKQISCKQTSVTHPEIWHQLLIQSLLQKVRTDLQHRTLTHKRRFHRFHFWKLCLSQSKALFRQRVCKMTGLIYLLQ